MPTMLQRTNRRETTTEIANDERARRAISTKLHVFSFLVFISVFALSTGANVAAENESRPARMRRYDANRIDTDEIFELGGYSESRQDRQRELGNKSKNVSYGEGSWLRGTSKYNLVSHILTVLFSN